MRTFLRRTLKFLTVVILLLSLCGIGGILFLHFHPVSLEYLLPSGTKGVEWTRTRLEYSRLELSFAQGFFVRAKDSRLITKHEEEEIAAELGALDVYLSTSRLLRGQIAPTRIIAKELSIPVELSAGGLQIAGLWLGEDNETHGKQFDLLEVLNELQQEDSTLPQALSELRTFLIKDADIVFEDRIHQATWHGQELKVVFTKIRTELLAFSIQLLLRREESELPITFYLEHAAGEDKAAIEISADFTGLHSLRGYVLSEISEAIQGDSSFNAKTTLRADNTLDASRVTLRSKNGSITAPRVFSHPIKYAALQMEATYDPQNDGSVVIDKLMLRDSQDFVITAKGSFNSLGTTPQVDATFELSPTTVDHMANYLPDVASPELSKWLDENLKYAQVENGRVEIAGPLKAFPFAEEDAETKFHAGFDFRGLEVRFDEDFPPGTSLDGRFEMDRGRITITSPSGKLSEQDVSDLTVEIIDVIKKGEPVVLTVKGQASGTVGNAIQIFAEHLKQTGHDFTATGTHRADVLVSLPLDTEHTVDDLSYTVRSKAHDLRLTRADRSQVFSARSLDVEVSDKGIRAWGQGTFNGAPVSINVKDQAGGKSQVHIETTLKKEFYERFIPQDVVTLDGLIPLKLDIHKDENKGVGYSASFDLKDAKMSVNALQWSKAEGIRGGLDLKGLFSAKEQILEIGQLSLKAPQLEIGGNARLLLDDLHKSKVNLRPFRIGGTDLNILFKQGHLRLAGNTLDRSSVGMRGGREDTPEIKDLDVGLNIGKVILEAGTLEALKGRLIKKHNRWQVFELSSKVSEQGTVELKLEQENNRPVLRVRSSDAGNTLRLIGAEDEYTGGSLRGWLRFPEGKAFHFEQSDGDFRIEDLTVVQSQTIFQILSYFSLQNWLNREDGVLFGRIRTPMRIDGKVLRFNDARLEGPIITIFFSGTIDLKTGSLRIEGQAVPLQSVGRLTQAVPIIGSVISGTQRRLMSARFRISGNLETPRVRIFGVRVSG